MYLVRPELLADHDGEMIEDLSALSKLLLGLFGVQGAIGDPRGEVVPLLDRVSFERTVLQKTSQEFNENGYLVRMRDSYTNPYESKRIESFEIFGLTKRIHETNLWKTGLRNESTIRIFGSSGHETNPRNESLRFGFANPDSRIRIRESASLDS